MSTTSRPRPPGPARGAGGTGRALVLLASSACLTVLGSPAAEAGSTGGADQLQVDLAGDGRGWLGRLDTPLLEAPLLLPGERATREFRLRNSSGYDVLVFAGPREAQCPAPRCTSDALSVTVEQLTPGAGGGTTWAPVWRNLQDADAGLPGRSTLPPGGVGAFRVTAALDPALTEQPATADLPEVQVALTLDATALQGEVLSGNGERGAVTVERRTAPRGVAGLPRTAGTVLPFTGSTAMLGLVLLGAGAVAAGAAVVLASRRGRA